MFLRWQKRKRKSRAFGGGRRDTDTHWAAILAESVRVDGEPTQRHVAYLGGITDSGIEADAQRALFWQKATEQLDRLANGSQKTTAHALRMRSKRECLGSHGPSLMICGRKRHYGTGPESHNSTGF
jgi:hypothetical protein